MPISIKKAQENLGYSKSPWSHMKGGRYYSQALTAAAATTASLAADDMQATPFLVGRRAFFDRIWIEVTTAVAGEARMGVYVDNGTVYPGRLVLDAGPVDTGAAGVKEVSIDLGLPSGLYWLVLLTNAAPTFRASATGTLMAFHLGAAGIEVAPAQAARMRITYTYGALPAVFPAGAGYAATTGPMVQLRRKP